MDQEKKLLKELVKTRNILKKKLHNIKTNEADTHNQLRNTFKPITEPLKEFINKSQNFKSVATEKAKHEFKRQSNKNLSFDDASASLQSSTPKKFKEVKHDDDDDDDFYSQSETIENSKIKEINADLSLLQMKDELDTLYGPYKDFNNEWKFGDSNITINDDKIQIRNQIWALTPGLFSLMFHKTPTGYDKSELQIYKKILFNTNAHKRDYRADGQIKGTRAYKYKHIIKKLFKENAQTSLPISLSTSTTRNRRKDNYMGDGLMNFNSCKANYIYWDDPNELVDRLRLLLASQAAGHTNHNNEIVSIIEELYEANIIE